MLKNCIYPSTFVLVLLLGSNVYAQDFKSEVSYDPQGLIPDAYLDLNADTVTVTSNTSAFASSDSFISTGAHQHSTYMSITADTNVSGSMNTHVSMGAGGVGIASSVWHTSFVNGLAPMSYAMNIDINNGSVHLGGWTADTSRRNMQGGFSANILVNGQSVWSSSQKLTLTSAGASLTKSGYDIGASNISYTEKSDYTDQQASYSPNNFMGLINLGSFAAGQMIDVTYTLSSFARWEDPAGCAYECGGVFASISDPTGNGSNMRIVPTVTAVPEPQTYALLLAGLGLIGAATRRRSTPRA